MSVRPGVNQAEVAALFRQMNLLPDRVNRNIMTGAVRAGAKGLQDEVKARVPYELGFLQDAIKIKTKTKQTWSRASVYVKKVVLENGKMAKSTTQYAYYQEYGTKNMPSSPFFRPVLELNKQKVVEDARRYFVPRFIREKRRLGLE